mmetsp:Transcript_151265/g.466560  ORF Transcript_151265/g.466560 Transcript_151265/m.466560 type:complete len:346 (+) Transcript_151265:949-1986(+)
MCHVSLQSSAAVLDAAAEPPEPTGNRCTSAGRRPGKEELPADESKSIALPEWSAAQRHTAESEESGSWRVRACNNSSCDLQPSSLKTIVFSPEASETCRGSGGVAAPPPGQHAATPTAMGAQCAIRSGSATSPPAPDAVGLVGNGAPPRCLSCLLNAERRRTACRRRSGLSTAMSTQEAPPAWRRVGSAPRSSKKPTAPSLPASTARCRGDIPYASSACSSARRASSKVSDPRSPRCAAQWAAVHPPLSPPASISAPPRSARSRAAAWCPCWMATMSSVAPWLSRTDGSARASSRASTMQESPPNTAHIRGVCRSEGWTSTGTPAAAADRMKSTQPPRAAQCSGE